MKKMFKFFVATAAIAAGVTGCSSEENFGGKENPTMDRANLTILIANQSTETRAVVDANATADEKKIKSVSLFVFGSGTTAEADTIIQFANLTEAGANKYQATFHSAPVGTKSIYAGVNLTQTMHDKIKNGGVNAVWTAANTTDLGEFYESTGFPMFSDSSKVKTIVQGQTNQVEIPVKRWVAKVTMHTSSAFEANASNERTVNGMTVGENLTFAMGQANTKFYPLPQTNNVDPNWTFTGSMPYQADFINYFNTTSYSGQFADISKFVAVSKASESVADPSLHQKAYVLENTHKAKIKGELTYGSVKATFVPAATHSFDGSTVTATPYAIGTAPALLYVFNNGGLFYYFTDLTEANNYKSVSNLDYKTYHDGLCFYDVYLDPNFDYNVLRNDYYQVTITKVNKLGREVAEIDDPDSEIGAVADIEFTIVVRPWTVIGWDEELGKNQ